VLLYIPDVTAEPQVYYWQDLSPGETLVGFSHGGLGIITAIREYTLISGFHKLLVWSVPTEKPAPDEKATLKFAHTLELEPEQTFGYTFGPNGRTFRTVYRESKSPRLYSLLEVREVDARTGRSTKAAAKVTGELTAYTLSADGKVLVTLDSMGNVVATDVDAGKQMWTASMKEAPSFGALGPNAQFGGGGGYAEPRGLLVLSENGQTLLASRGGVHQPVVLNAKNGETLPAPEGVGFVVLQPQSCRLSSDGQLLVLGGERAVERQRGKGGFGGPPSSFESGGNFLSVWDVATGKPIKSWSQEATVSFLPNAPVLAVFEGTRSGTTRLGLWDFSAEPPAKK
jgi:WD40 repeat protein